MRTNRGALSPPPARMGRPPTGRGEQVAVRVHPPMMSVLDEWRDRQIERLSRPEAMRRLAAMALKGEL